MKPRRGAAIALTSGLGVVSLLGVGMFFRKEITAARHLHRLQTEEGYLARVIEKPDGSVEDLAVRWLAATPGGKNALFLLQATELAVEPASWSCGPGVLASQGFVWLDEEHLRSDTLCDGRRTWSARHVQNTARLHAIARYLPFLQGTEFRWPDDSTLRLHVMPKSHAADLMGQPDLDLTATDPWILWFERLPDPPAKSAR